MKSNTFVFLGAIILNLLGNCQWSWCGNIEVDNSYIKIGEFHGNELDNKKNCVLDDVDLFNMIVNTPSSCHMIRELTLGVEFDFQLYYAEKKITPKFSMALSTASKRAILDEIMRNNVGSNWNENNGVINIHSYQINKDSVSISSVLDKTIPGFEVKKITLAYALENLVRLANENNLQITTSALERSIKTGIAVRKQEEEKDLQYYSPETFITVSIPHKVSIRECLNAIVAANPPALWWAAKWGQKIFLQTQDYKRYREISKPKSIPQKDSFKGFGFGNNKNGK